VIRSDSPDFLKREARPHSIPNEEVSKINYSKLTQEKSLRHFSFIPHCPV
jgi:hypothetical protein